MNDANGRKRVIFVDDEPRVLNGIRRALVQRRDEWEMVFVVSGTEALDVLSGTHVDVLVTDIAMPRINGLDLVKHTNMEHPNTKCIVLTGTADLKLAEQLINSASVFRFYTKPYSAELLSEGIADALKSKAIDPAVPFRSEDEEFELGILDKISTGVLVASENGRIQFMNQSAAKVLSKNNAIGVGPSDMLKGQTPDQSKQLLGLIKDVATSRFEETRGLTLTDPESGESLHFIFSAHRDDSVIVFLTDPSETPLPDAKLIGELFHLTPSESNLTERLVKGDSIKEAATALGITEQSARTYLKNILSKMSAGRQAELLRRILLTNLPG